jgi:hypothetical protein
LAVGSSSWQRQQAGGSGSIHILACHHQSLFPTVTSSNNHAHFSLQALDYGVREGNILGIRHGFKGFLAKPHRPVVLTRQVRTGARGGLLGAGAGWQLHKCLCRRHALSP